MPFEFKNTELKGLKVIEPQVFKDDRGLFLEIYTKNEFYEAGIETEFVQGNHSKSEKNCPERSALPERTTFPGETGEMY